VITDYTNETFSCWVLGGNQWDIEGKEGGGGGMG
jgi:hypothetical protein